VLVSGSPRFDAQSHFAGTLAVFTDLSELKRLEKQLLQAQKMEAVGRLTAGIAHDFNNLLTVIMGFAQLMKLQLVPGDPLREPLDKIISAGGSAASLIQQLMASSRQQVLQPQVLQLNAVLERLGTMLRRIIGEDVALEMAPSGDLWPVNVDPTQLQQVIANLVVNAREAMPQGGRLRIETANVTLDESQAAGIVEGRPGDYVTMRVSDTGQGISPEVQAHIFEPFYTTKSQGTGLGLATVYGILAQSGGFIHLQSVEGQGTTFTVYLPGARGEAEPVAARPHAAAAPRGTETILLVEDSAEVREYAGEVLCGQGYTVLEANCGREALRKAADHAGHIHLLMTDVVMPDMSGRVVARRLADMRPDLKTLFMSGYTDDVLETRGALGAGAAFLQKPFSALDLAHTVRRILDEPAAAGG
jgi:nitrogen-specific signal transduction histidine kinase/ActR/RegA family two-component response regulator